MNALELRGLTKHYKDFTLGPLDLTLPGGTICGLIGENGAGKSTTIKLILDMLQKDGGTVTILGRDSRTDLVHTKEEIGVVLGSDGIPLCLNAVEVGKVMAGIYRNWDAGDYTAFCRKFDLPPDKSIRITPLECRGSCALRWRFPTTQSCCCWMKPPMGWTRWCGTR